MDTLIAFVVAAVITALLRTRVFEGPKGPGRAGSRGGGKGQAVFRGAPGPASPHRHRPMHRLRNLHHRLPRRRCSCHAGRQGCHRERIQVYRPQPVCRGLSGRGHHHGDGQPEHGRGHAVPDARIRNQHPEPVHRGRAGRVGADQECRQPGPGLHRHDCNQDTAANAKRSRTSTTC